MGDSVNVAKIPFVAPIGLEDPTTVAAAAAQLHGRQFGSRTVTARSSRERDAGWCRQQQRARHDSRESVGSCGRLFVAVAGGADLRISRVSGWSDAPAANLADFPGWCESSEPYGTGTAVPVLQPVLARIRPERT